MHNIFRSAHHFFSKNFIFQDLLTNAISNFSRENQNGDLDCTENNENYAENGDSDRVNNNEESSLFSQILFNSQSVYPNVINESQKGELKIHTPLLIQVQMRTIYFASTPLFFVILFCISIFYSIVSILIF